MSELSNLIYIQLLELYALDLEVEVLAEKLKNIPYQSPVQPVPRTPYPWDQPNTIPWPNTQPFFYGPPYKVTCSTGPYTNDFGQASFKTEEFPAEHHKYSEDWDAWYDPDKNEWLENKCSDPTCVFCVGRPERPLPVNVHER